jgi:hypothetical protein
MGLPDSRHRGELIFSVKKLILCLTLVLSGHCHAAIVYPKAPDGGGEIVSNNLDAKFLGVSSTKNLKIKVPYREYYVGMTNLAAGQLLSAATLGGWKYLVIHRTNAVGAAELNTDEKTGNEPRFNSLEKPFFPDAPLKALRIAEQLPQVIKSDYEFRHLDIMHHFVAVWLHGQSDDIIIPIPLTFAPLKAYQPYSESQIIQLLQPEAQRDIEMEKKLDEQEQKNKDAYSQAMTDYEKTQGGNCGKIVYSGDAAIGKNLQNAEPNVRMLKLRGTSSECGELYYKAKVTVGENRGIVKKVEILEKATEFP